MTEMPRLFLSIVVVAAGAVACSRAASAPHTTPEPILVKRGDQAAIAAARRDSAQKPYTEADVHFMQGMISHHAQAIVMAKMAYDHGASSAIRTLAGRVINAQTDEIAIMQQWLADRLQDVPEPDPAGMKMNMGGMQHVMLMPGMLSPEQMKQLGASRGKEFDRLFLTLMIQHHTGAVDMVKELFATPGAGQNDSVFKLASDVNVDQTTEIARMEKMLGELKP